MGKNKVDRSLTSGQGGSDLATKQLSAKFPSGVAGSSVPASSIEWGFSGQRGRAWTQDLDDVLTAGCSGPPGRVWGVSHGVHAGKMLGPHSAVAVKLET